MQNQITPLVFSEGSTLSKFSDIKLDTLESVLRNTTKL